MRATTRIALLVTAALVLLGITAPAASASGRRHGDRHRHEFAGHTQGRSASDPDGTSNGGPDKPGFRGGFSADRDGNNGCGNDDDREDDNNGNCGRKRAADDDRDKARHDDDRDKAGADDDRDKARVAGEIAERRKVLCQTILGVLGRTESKGTLEVSGDTDAKVVKTHVMSVVFKPAVLAAIQAVINTVIQPAEQPATPITFQPAAVEAVVKAATTPETTQAEVAAASTTPATPTASPAETAVLGAQVEQQAAPALAPTQVAGAQESQNQLGALATTGLALGGLALLGAALVAIGRLARGASRV
jgi:hypothetical protein